MEMGAREVKRNIPNNTKKNHARGGKFLFLKKKIGKIHRRRVCHNHAKNKVIVEKEAVGAVAKDPLNV